MARKGLENRVRRAADAALERQQYVSAIDVLVGLGWLAPPNVDLWRHRRMDALERVVQVDPGKVTDAMARLERWARERGLALSEPDYGSLRFSINGDTTVERAYRMRWVAPDFSEREVEKPSTPKDLVVIMAVKDWTCTSCGGTGTMLVMEDAGPRCLDCADLGHLDFVPSGDAALTRRSKKASRLSAVVVRWSRARKRYERQGILAEQEAIERAEQECLSDADVRARRQERDRVRRAEQDVRFQAEFAAAIRQQFPGCPADRAEAIARHAATRSSGRVGRSAAGKALEPDAVRLAVAASVRHNDTDYDELLMSGIDRETARDRIWERVEDVLSGWRGGQS
ncbi:DUF2293 domain-containing protein [Mycolicibacterium sp. XJ870]